MTTSGMLNLGVAPRGWRKVFQYRGTVCATARVSTSATTNHRLTCAPRAAVPTPNDSLTRSLPVCVLPDSSHAIDLCCFASNNGARTLPRRVKNPPLMLQRIDYGVAGRQTHRPGGHTCCYILRYVLLHPVEGGSSRETQRDAETCRVGGNVELGVYSLRPNLPQRSGFITLSLLADRYVHVVATWGFSGRGFPLDLDGYAVRGVRKSLAGEPHGASVVGVCVGGV